MEVFSRILQGVPGLNDGVDEQDLELTCGKFKRMNCRKTEMFKLLYRETFSLWVNSRLQ